MSPLSLCRRWFSIQNSQLVYQKKLKASSYRVKLTLRGEVQEGVDWSHIDCSVVNQKSSAADELLINLEMTEAIVIFRPSLILCLSSVCGPVIRGIQLQEKHAILVLCLRTRRSEKFFVCYQDSLTVVVEDLRLCSVKPFEDIERRFCFEVVSPSK